MWGDICDLSQALWIDLDSTWWELLCLFALFPLLLQSRLEEPRWGKISNSMLCATIFNCATSPHSFRPHNLCTHRNEIMFRSSQINFHFQSLQSVLLSLKCSPFFCSASVVLFEHFFAVPVFHESRPQPTTPTSNKTMKFSVRRPKTQSGKEMQIQSQSSYSPMSRLWMKKYLTRGRTAKREPNNGKKLKTFGPCSIATFWADGALCD